MKKLILSMTVFAAVYTINAQTQPPNAGMENWSSSPLNEPKDPTGWVSENVLASALLTFPATNTNPTSVTQDNVAPAPFAGSFSAKIVTVVTTTNPGYPSIPDTSGSLFLGSVSTTSPYVFPGLAYTDKPMTFSFQSAYVPSGADVASVSVRLTKWNTATTPASRTTISQDLVVIPASATFMPNSFNLTYLNTTTFPDTLQIMFNACGTRNMAKPGSTLIIDQLAFTGISGIQEYKNNVRFSTYPNPANSILNLVTDSKQVENLSVYDITGRVIETMKITSDRTVLNTSSYTAGIYFYSAVNNQGEIVARGKFNVIR